MDSWEFNKIAGAVLAALLIAFGGSTLIGTMMGSHGDENIGYTLPVDISADTGGSQPEAKAGFTFAAVAKEMQTASAEAGENVFKKCKTCHTPNEGGKNGVGPNLWNVVNRDKATVDGFNYSKVLKEKEGKWDYESLAEFVHDPKGYARGTKMAFAGLKDTADVANVLAYLRSLSASPAPLPEAPAAENAKPEAATSDGGAAPEKTSAPDSQSATGTKGSPPVVPKEEKPAPDAGDTTSAGKAGTAPPKETAPAAQPDGKATSTQPKPASNDETKQPAPASNDQPKQPQGAEPPKN